MIRRLEADLVKNSEKDSQFVHLVCSLHPELTVFVANNGGGKTSILDAVRIAFDTYLGAFPTGRGKGIKLTDVRQVNSKSEVFQMEQAFPVEVDAIGQLTDYAEPIAWPRSLNTAKLWWRAFKRR